MLNSIQLCYYWGCFQLDQYHVGTGAKATAAESFTSATGIVFYTLYLQTRRHYFLLLSCLLAVSFPFPALLLLLLLGSGKCSKSASSSELDSDCGVKDFLCVYLLQWPLSDRFSFEGLQCSWKVKIFCKSSGIGLGLRPPACKKKNWTAKMFTMVSHALTLDLPSWALKWLLHLHHYWHLQQT